MYKVEGVSSERTIMFVVAGDVEFTVDRPHTFLRLNLKDAYDLLRWLGYTPSDFGYMEVADLRARCRRRLWPEPRNIDPGYPERKEVKPGGFQITHPGRPAGFLRAKTEEMLRLVDRAVSLAEHSGIDHDCILFS